MIRFETIGNVTARSKDELKQYFDYYKLNSANYWIDLLKIKKEEIVSRSRKLIRWFL